MTNFNPAYVSPEMWDFFFFPFLAGCVSSILVLCLLGWANHLTHGKALHRVWVLFGLCLVLGNWWLMFFENYAKLAFLLPTIVSWLGVWAGTLVVRPAQHNSGDDNDHIQ